jgi:hypothetical protein
MGLACDRRHPYPPVQGMPPVWLPPPLWKEAIIVVIPKPDRPDYSLPKAHHPISLLECISKLLEKVVTQQIQHNLTTHDLIPTTQFGGRQHSSCLDTGLSLIHDVQDAHRQPSGAYSAESSCSM